MYAFRFEDINILTYGDAGDNVIILQEKLKILGYFPFNIDGSYAEKTEEAVRKFQENNGLEVTGIANLKTMQTLYEKTDLIVTGKANYPTIRIGAKGDLVEMLQSKLKKLYYFNYDVTGYFGKITEKAVRKFQSNNKITADGIVGKNTWNLLDMLYSPLAKCENSNENMPINTYVVVKGDTLYSIAKRFNTTVQKIKELNNITTDIIKIGQVLKIPSSMENVYVVKKGDTLYSIAKKYNTTVENIMNINNLNSTIIQIGQKLIIK